MNNLKKISFVLLYAFCFFIACHINIYALDSTGYTTNGFEMDTELLKCVMQSNNEIDSNNDGILSLQEWSKATNLSLDCTNCNITDWSALKELKFVKKLSISNIENADLSILTETKGISELELNIQSLAYISGLNSKDLKIKSLSINSKEVVDLKQLSYATSLEKLSLNAPKLLNCDSFSSLINVLELNIDVSSGAGFEYFSSNKSLKKMTITCSSLTNLDFLTGFNKLVYLDVSNCNISDISIIDKLNSLQTINLSGNKIERLCIPENIKTIYLKDNPIEPIDALVGIIGWGYEKDINIEEGFYYQLSLPKCDIIDTNTISFSTNDTNNIRISDNKIEFLRKGNAKLYVNTNGALAFDYDINITESENPLYFKLLKGDADNNKIVNAVDALLLLKTLAKLDEMNSSFSIRQNDFNQNYCIDSDDALFILKIAAKLETSQLIDDPENFYSTINYKNGYPTADFISKDLNKNTYFTAESGSLNISERGGSFYKIIDGQFCRPLDIKYKSDGFDSLYWQLRWLIEDSITSNQLEYLDINFDDFKNKIETEGSFNGYFFQTKAYATALISHDSGMCIYISDSNELYFYHISRIDMFSRESSQKMFKYTGELPNALTYTSINKLYNQYLKSE